jgi:arginine N-succinyltransferase
MSGPAYVLRAAGPQDIEGFKRLREVAGPGFTSLMLDDAALAEKLALSQASFASTATAPGSERYFIALEDVASGEIVGCCGVKATIGETPPFFNFRIVRQAQSSAVVSRRFDMQVLIGVNDFTGCSEVGSLFVMPDHRAGGIGRALAQCRYLMMAVNPGRFRDQVVSELRGVVSADGHSPFWDAVGRHFFRMEFGEADKLSATTDNQFILDLMPQHPIYIDLLPEAARAVIGLCHDDGAGARRLLEWEGFEFSNIVDIFDGGPLMSVSRDKIRTLREVRRLRVSAAAPPDAAWRRALLCTPALSRFRCISTRVARAGDTAHVSLEALQALRCSEGGEILAWIDDAD